jgi:6-phosphogluconolactonase
MDIARLVPGDPVHNVRDVEVALTGLYHGRRCMTLTHPLLNRSRHILWLVTGSEKAEMLARLVARDPSIPAGHVRTDHAAVIADQASSLTEDLQVG